jgi:hypothetical protein
MTWKPASEADIWEYFNRAWDKMSGSERHFWETVRIDPVKWQCSPWGDHSGGFWVVAILGSRVVWYNDIEKGFNCSEYQVFGQFSDFWCNQDDLDEVVRKLKNNLDHGYFTLWRAGPPQSVL